MQDFNIYFPKDNLNPQGWITDFITPYIKRTNFNRSIEANIFYDKEFSSDSSKHLKKQFNNDADYQDFLARRFGKVDESKFIFLNANFLDYVETNIKYRNSKLAPSEINKYMKFMSSAKPHQLAFLQNYMRLSYGFKTKSGEKEYTFIDFPFSQKFDEDFILNNNNMNGGVKYVRSEGCGIKRIDVKNDFNFVTHVNSQIKIDFFLGNMKILTNEIDENGIPTNKEINKNKYPHGFNFLKLITSFDLSKEVLRLEYGVRVAPGFEEQVDNDLDLRRIIEEKERKILFLNMINYQFDFAQNGVITLSVNYLDLGTSAFLLPNDIINPKLDSEMFKEIGKYQELVKKSNDLKNRRKELEEEVKTYYKKILDESKETQPAPTNEIEKKKLEMESKYTVLSRELEKTQKELKEIFETLFLDKIKLQGQLFALNFNTKKTNDEYFMNMNTFLVKPRDGSFLKLFEINKKYSLKKYRDYLQRKNIILNVNDNIIENLFKQYLNVPDGEEKKETEKKFGNFMFFPLKALFSAAFSFLEDSEKDQIPHILFGNVYIPYGSRDVAINIGDLLVERDTFQSWFYENCISKDMKSYSFGAFVTDIINDLIPRITYRNQILNTKSSSVIKVKYLNFNPNFTDEQKRDLYQKDNIDNLLEFGRHLSAAPDSLHTNKIIYISEQNSISSNEQSPSMKNNPGNFIYDEAEDSKNGILHIKPGADSGLLKSVSFSAHDNSKIRSAYAIEALANSASRILLFYYSMNLSMIGNNVFEYDNFVCVPLNALGLESSDSDPGIAGYYKVLGTNDTIDNSLNYNTTADCVWVRSPKVNKYQNLFTIKIDEIEKIKDNLRLETNTFEKYISDRLSISPEAQPANGSGAKISAEQTGKTSTSN